MTQNSVLSDSFGMINTEDHQPKSIIFQVGDTWAVKITRDGVVSNPDVPTDAGAKAIFEALKPYIEQLQQ